MVYAADLPFPLYRRQAGVTRLCHDRYHHNKKIEWCERFPVGTSTARDKMTRAIIQADQIMALAAN
jgi:1,2-phenylacetyl-CoA epoxidase catalytic subunit